MNFLYLVNKKNNNVELTFDEINYIVSSYLSGVINDNEMTLFLKSVLKNDMTDNEIFNLTEIFIKSGDILKYNFDYVDKHSTGGVGDKTSLIISPLVASTGVKVLKMSGRGLGHTGGTIDKLESISGFEVELSKEEIEANINNINMALISQTSNLVPADKKIYALRDITNTVSSIPLIASSIMSKKIASGASNIVIDLKVGTGALIKNIDEARRLANLMIKIGNEFNRKVVCVLTDMNYPSGNTIGNSLEVLESIEILNNKGNKDLRELCLVLASYMISLDKNITYDEAYDEALNNLNNKRAFSFFIKFIKLQSGDLTTLSLSQKVKIIKADKKGYITKLDAYKFGEFVRNLGAGRLTKDDVIDHSVGVSFLKHIGDHVKKGEPIYKIYYQKDFDASFLTDAVEIEKDKPSKKIILEIIGG